MPEPQFTLVGESSTARYTVALTKLLGIGSRRSAEAHARSLGLKILPVGDAKWIRPVALVYRNDGYVSPAARRFIEIVKEQAMRIAPGRQFSRRQ